MDLIKQIQTKFMEMTSQFSSLFKHIQELHTQFSEKQKPKIRLASHLQQISSKWTQYKHQIKQLEKKKQFLSKLLQTREDQLIKQKYRQRLLIKKIKILEEMIKKFLGGSARITNKEIILPSGEKLILEQDAIALDNMQYVQTRSNVFTKALYSCTLNIYNIIHAFVQFNLDFNPHKQFLSTMQQQMNIQWKQIQTESKCTIQFEHRKLKSMVQECSKFQNDTIQQLGLLRRKVSEIDTINQNWQLLGKTLERTERRVSQKTKIQNNYEKIVKGQRIMIERVLHTAQQGGKLWNLCNKHRQKLVCYNITQQQELFKDQIVKYVHCFKDLLGSEQQDYQSSLNSLKMIVLHETNLITSLNNDILRIQVEIQVRKKAIEDGLRVIFNQMYNQIYQKEMPHRSFIKSQRMDRSNGNIPLGFGQGDSQHKRNKSNHLSSVQKMNNSNILGDLGQQKDFSKKQTNQQKKPGYYKKVSRKPSIKLNPLQKNKQPHSSQVTDTIQKPKVQMSKYEISNDSLNKQSPTVTHNFIAQQIKQFIENKKQVQAQQGMKAYLNIVNKTINQSKQIQTSLNQMLDFIKITFPQQNKYYQPFKELGYSDSIGKLRFYYQIPYDINVYPPSIIKEVSQDFIKQQLSQRSSYKQPEKVEPKVYVINYTQTQIYKYIEVATQTQKQQSVITIPTINQKHLNVMKQIIQVQISPVVINKQIRVPVVTSSQGVQKDVDPEQFEAFSLNQKIRMSTQLIEKKQQIIQLRLFKEKFLQIQKIHQICIQTQKGYQNDLLSKDQKLKLYEKQLQTLKQLEKKCSMLKSQKQFLQFQLKHSEEQKNQRILRQQDFIAQILCQAPSTLGENISKELQQKIIALMNKIINLSKNLSDSMDEMQLSSMKITEDIDHLKHFVCLRLNSTLEAITKDDITLGDNIVVDKKKQNEKQ